MRTRTRKRARQWERAHRHAVVDDDVGHAFGGTLRHPRRAIARHLEAQSRAPSVVLLRLRAADALIALKEADLQQFFSAETNSRQGATRTWRGNVRLSSEQRCAPGLTDLVGVGVALFAHHAGLQADVALFFLLRLVLAQHAQLRRE